MNPTTMHCLSMLLKEVGYELPGWTTSWGCVVAVHLGTLLRRGWGHDDRRSHTELEIVDIEDVDNLKMFVKAFMLDIHFTREDR